jgi:hypothetical protein
MPQSLTLHASREGGIQKERPKRRHCSIALAASSRLHSSLQKLGKRVGQSTPMKRERQEGAHGVWRAGGGVQKGGAIEGAQEQSGPHRSQRGNGFRFGVCWYGYIRRSANV